MRQRAEAMASAAQQAICEAASVIDGGEFSNDRWQRDAGGGGLTRVLQDSAVFEKAGVNVSAVFGDVSPQMATALEIPSRKPQTFFATGVSTVLHPHNPHAPTAHANFRYFEIHERDEQTPATLPTDGRAPTRWWVGGGADLTPAYLYQEDAEHFHRTLKAACDEHDASYYSRFKTWCDEYFFLPHRGESRGVGGIFFDRLADHGPERMLEFCTRGAEAFVAAYFPLVEKRCKLPFDDEQRRWQQLRRGRYVEFNLLYDRGTAFGLKSGGRTESILMSLPLTARWEVDMLPREDSPEAALVEVLQNPRKWVADREAV
jgi:coproporphyrinogen III oxidase